MADTPETKFQMKVRSELKKIPGLWFYKASDRAASGIPDIIGCYQGRFFAWELKVPPNKLKRGSLQEHVVLQILESGGLAREVVPDTLASAIKELTCLPG